MGVAGHKKTRTRHGDIKWLSRPEIDSCRLFIFSSECFRVNRNCVQLLASQYETANSARASSLFGSSLRGLPRAQNLAKCRSRRRIRWCTRPTSSALAKWLIRAGFCVPQACNAPREGLGLGEGLFLLTLPNLGRADREGTRPKAAKMVKVLPSRGRTHPGFRRPGAVGANRLGRGPTSRRSGRWL